MRFHEGRTQYALTEAPERTVPLRDVPYVPPPRVRPAAAKERIPFDCWRAIYRGDIDMFLGEMMDALADEAVAEDIAPLMQAVPDLQYWLYLHSSSARRDMQTELLG